MSESSESATERAEFRYRHADGSWVWLEGVGSNQTGTVLDGFVIDTREIGEHKQREQRLARQNERLDEFASMVSHDMRNPLRVFSTSLDLFAETGNDDHYERCRSAVDRMQRLIDDLLDLARQGESVVDPDAVALEDLVDRAWQTVETPDATLVVEDSARVEADPQQTRRLLENLFENAVEHGDETVTVTVGTSEGGMYVADDGPGVPEADRAEVFEAGYSGVVHPRLLDGSTDLALADPVGLPGVLRVLRRRTLGENLHRDGVWCLPTAVLALLGVVVATVVRGGHRALVEVWR